jgi:hypothetical protein
MNARLRRRGNRGANRTETPNIANLVEQATALAPVPARAEGT